MLPQDPPPWIVRWTAWLLLGFISVALILLDRGEAAGDGALSVRARAGERR